MESMSHDPAAGAIGLHVVDIATRGLASGATASGAVTALAPAGADEVSLQAVAAFAAEGAAMLALYNAAQEEVARTGAALTDIARMYAQVDGEAAGALETGGARFSGLPFVSRSGAGLMAEPTFANPDPTLPVSTPTVPVSTPNPAPTVPVSAPTAPGAGFPGAGRCRVDVAGCRRCPAELARLAGPGRIGGRGRRAGTGLIAHRPAGRRRAG